MAFVTDKEELKSGLVIFMRGDVEHRNFYCRINLIKEDRYKTISLHTADRESARDRAFGRRARRCASGVDLADQGLAAFKHPRNNSSNSTHMG